MNWPGGDAIRVAALCSCRMLMTGLALLGILGLVVGCVHVPEAKEFRVGLTRTELRDTFGPPAHTQTLIKTSDVIFGPLEDFWPRVPRGSMVEIWAYRVSNGTVELYFVDDSAQVQGTGFVPTGAVY